MDVIYNILESTTLKYPQKEAFVHNNKRYTYQKINDAVDCLAGFLSAQGICKGERVGIFSSKNIDEIIAIFAILRIGAIFVHINPHFKEDQLSYVVSDCGIKAIFVHETKAKIFNNVFSDKHIFNTVIYMAARINYENTNSYYMEQIINHTGKTAAISANIAEHDPAAIIYTSGSTGKPKGIVVTQKIFYDSTVASVNVLNNNSFDRIISITPFSFDGALSQLFTSIYAGGTLVLNDSNFPKDIVNTMLKEKITGFHAVPSFWRMLLQNYSPFSRNQYPDLRYVSIIGEVFPHDELMKLRAVLKGTQFYMMYGITEAFRSTFLHPDDFEQKNPSVGKPFPGVQIDIVNAQGEVCAPGETGEIVHRGAFVSPGYWNDPRRTALVFKEGALYTGDLGKKDHEGFIYFIGRKDNMIKSMGYRISPEEIEKCIYKMKEIADVAVIAVADEVEFKSKIVAFIACNAGHVLTSKDVLAHCKLHLPYYMIPYKVEFIADMPKTGTFKINRSQLQYCREKTL